MIGYLLLGGAIVCEVFATTMMKLSNGFTVLPPSAACVLGYCLCFFLFSKSLLTIDLSIGYAVWAAVGIILTSIVAVMLFGEQLTPPVLFGMALIIVGVVVVNMFSSAH